MNIRKTFKVVAESAALLALPIVFESFVQPRVDEKIPSSDEIVSLSSVSDSLKAVDDSDVVFIAEVMPAFPGGDTALMNYINKNVNYPEAAKESDLHGKVYVQFIINVNGEVANPLVARGVDPILDKEAIRVVQSMPKWTPGMQNGKPVKVSYVVPVTF